MFSQGHPYGFPVGVKLVVKEQRMGSLWGKKYPSAGTGIRNCAPQRPPPPKRV